MRKKKKNIGNVRVKSKKKRKRKIIIAILILFLMLGICTYYYFYIYDGEKIDINLELPIPVETRKPVTVVDETSNKRPIAVMIDNNVGNKSHIGLQDAYISYEAIVEGGLTRIMVLFKDKETTVIGPVRSSRHYFLDYALEHDALYAHFGWSTYAENDIKSLGVNNINGLYISNAYWRDYSVAAPHNVFTSIEKLYASAQNLGYATTSSQWENLNYTTKEVNLNEFEDKTVVCAELSEEETTSECNKNPNLIVANSVTIPYSYYQTRSYQYDTTIDAYLRFMNGNEHVDKVTGQQYYYKNIIIQKVSNHSLDSYGRQDLNTTGSGDGYYITGGYALPIIWKKDSRSGKTTYTYTDGTKVKIKDGNTFIQIQPTNQTPEFN